MNRLFKPPRRRLALVGPCMAALALCACNSTVQYVPAARQVNRFIADSEMERALERGLQEVGERIAPLPAISNLAYAPRLLTPSFPKIGGKSGWLDLRAPLPAPATQPQAPDVDSFGAAERGIASWYAEQWAWKKTASGEIYNPHTFTAAHRTLPFNSVVRVKNLENGRSLLLRINNRGPFIKGRVIDVSPAAAKQLDFYNQGLTRVEVTRVR